MRQAALQQPALSVTVELTHHISRQQKGSRFLRTDEHRGAASPYVGELEPAIPEHVRLVLVRVLGESPAREGWPPRLAYARRSEPPAWRNTGAGHRVSSCGRARACECRECRRVLSTTPPNDHATRQPCASHTGDATSVATSGSPLRRSHCVSCLLIEAAGDRRDRSSSARLLPEALGGPAESQPRQSLQPEHWCVNLGFEASVTKTWVLIGEKGSP